MSPEFLCTSGYAALTPPLALIVPFWVLPTKTPLLFANAASVVVGTATGKVVSIDSTNRYIYYLPSVDSIGNFASFSAADTVHVGSTSKGVISSGGVSGAYPEVARNSGDIVYLENRGAVARAADQIEDIKLIIEM